MFDKHFQHNLHFLNYFIDVLKMFPIKHQFLELFYKCLTNVLSENICIENVCQTFINIYNVNKPWKRLVTPKGRVQKCFVNF